MKPQNITMQAFGPYLSETKVDFSKLYASGLFLITGQTGCGKTTILDAMSYALYGRASGCVRDVRDMRSTAAPSSLETRVSFEFELGGANYKFERSIKIREVKRRVGGSDLVTDYDENCHVFDGGLWRLLCSGTFVKEKAVELLGFSHEQFSQVVVLPQGEFRKLLTAPSLEKQKILEALFGTVRWQVFTKSLSERSKSLDTALFECGVKKSALYKNADCDDSEALCDRILQMHHALDEVAAEMGKRSFDYEATSAAMNVAVKLGSKFDELDVANKRLIELASELSEIEKKRQSLEYAQKAEKLISYIDKLDVEQTAAVQTRRNEIESLHILDTAKIEAEKARKTLESFVDGENQLKELSQQATRLESILVPAKTLSQVSGELKKKQDELSVSQKDASSSETEFKTLTKELDLLRAKIKDNFERYIAKLPELKSNKQTLDFQLQGFANLKIQETSTSELEILLEKKLLEYKTVSRSLKNEKSQLEKMLTAFEGDAAYRLAQGLHEGNPCLVCGSLLHPIPASAALSAPSKDELERQKSIISELEAKLANILEDGGKQRGEVNAAQKRLIELRGECEKYGCTEVEAAENQKAAITAFDEAEKVSLLQKSLNEKEKSYETKLEVVKTRYDSAKTALDKAAVEVSKLEGRVTELAVAVPEEFRDDVVLLVSINSLKLEYETLSQKIKTAEECYKVAQNTLLTSQERLKSAQGNLLSTQERLEAARLEYMKKFSLSGLPEGIDVRLLVLSQDKFEKIHTNVENYDRETYLQKDKAAALTEQLKDAERPDIEKIKDDVVQKREAERQATEQKVALEKDLENLEKTKKQLDENGLIEEKLRKDYSLYDHIYRLCNGENPLKTPIHQFVLGLMLDDIVTCANGHLSELSRGRFALVRSSTVGRGGGTKGLDLSVEDSWSGGERSVSTLSGGEMFLASLSLAFGLSDVVQAYAGGIRLDSLFIDEGFGTLDAETLDAAMSALERLRLSGRLIGIISHVNELRERIPAHIEVTRAADGSALTTVVAP